MNQRTKEATSSYSIIHRTPGPSISLYEQPQVLTEWDHRRSSVSGPAAPSITSVLRVSCLVGLQRCCLNMFELGRRAQNFPVRSPRSQKATRPGESTSTCLGRGRFRHPKVEESRSRLPRTIYDDLGILTGPTGQSCKPWDVLGHLGTSWHILGLGFGDLGCLSAGDW